jgi:hypothetical protein
MTGLEIIFWDYTPFDGDLYYNYVQNFRSLAPSVFPG